MTNHTVYVDQNEMVMLCRRHHIAKLSLFGSVLRDDFEPGRSDVDVLAEFTPEANKELTYFGFAAMKIELEELFHLEVDLSVADSLAPYLRDEILATAELLYDAA